MIALNGFIFNDLYKYFQLEETLHNILNQELTRLL